MVDYRITDRTELASLLHQHRLERYLDGPNDVDWVFRNDLVAGRENDMYVDLVQTEDGLEWWPPLPSTAPPLVPDAVRLVLALQDSGMFAAGALKRLERSWVDFDPTVESHFVDWSDRTANALRGGPSASLAIACELWPMPMTELELEPIAVTDEEIEKARRNVDAMCMQRGQPYAASMWGGCRCPTPPCHSEQDPPGWRQETCCRRKVARQQHQGWRGWVLVLPSDRISLHFPVVECSVTSAIGGAVEALPERSFVRRSDFDAPRGPVDTALSRLCVAGALVRVRKGLYWKGSPTRFGMSRPAIDDIALEVGGPGSGPAGIAAAHWLGLTNSSSRDLRRRSA